MLFYGDKPSIDYVTAARSTLKNYNTFITQDNKTAFDYKTKHQV